MAIKQKYNQTHSTNKKLNKMDPVKQNKLNPRCICCSDINNLWCFCMYGKWSLQVEAKLNFHVQMTNLFVWF